MKAAWVGLAVGLSFGLSLVASGAMAQAVPVAPGDLESLLPQSLDDFTVRESLAAQSSKTAMSEAAIAYVQRDTDVNVRIHIADLINNPELYDRFIATAGIVQANVSRVVDALIKHGGDGISVQAASADWGKKTLTELRVDVPGMQSVGSRSLRAGEATALTASELIDQWSIFGKGELVKRFGDVPIGRLGAVSGGAIALDHEAYGLGVDFSGTATRAKDGGRYFFLTPDAIGQFAVGLTEEAYPDGAYAKLYNASSADVAGWEVYQPQGKYGVLLLGVGGRFAVLVEGSGIDSTKPLKAAFDAIALGKLDGFTTK